MRAQELPRPSMPDDAAPPSAHDPSVIIRAHPCRRRARKEQQVQCAGSGVFPGRRGHARAGSGTPRAGREQPLSHRAHTPWRMRARPLVPPNQHEESWGRRVPVCRTITSRATGPVPTANLGSRPSDCLCQKQEARAPLLLPLSLWGGRTAPWLARACQGPGKDSL